MISAEEAQYKESQSGTAGPIGGEWASQGRLKGAPGAWAAPGTRRLAGTGRWHVQPGRDTYDLVPAP